MYIFPAHLLQKPTAHLPNVTKAIMEQGLALASNEKRCHTFNFKVESGVGK